LSQSLCVSVQIETKFGISSMSYYSKMITEAFQVILKYVAPDQEDIVIQNVCKKLDIYNVHMMNIHCVIIQKIHRTILKELNWQGR
jgi:septum formation topological specificity factor MinE